MKVKFEITSKNCEKFGGESPHSEADLENFEGMEGRGDTGFDDSTEEEEDGRAAFSSWTTVNSSGTCNTDNVIIMSILTRHKVYSLLTPPHLDPLEVVVALVVGEAVGPLPLGAEVPVEAEALGPGPPLLLITQVTHPPQGGLLTADLLEASETIQGLVLLTDQAALHHTAL